jgi:hypothetical protein
MLSGTGTAPPGPQVDTPAGEAWEVGPATVATAVFELAGAREELFPPAVHPTVPVLARFECIDAGSWQAARLGLSCRAGARPRLYVIGGFVAGDAECTRRLVDGWGWPAVQAEISLQPGYDRAGITVVVDDDVALEVDLRDPTPLASDDVQWFSALHPATTPEGPRLLQFDMRPAVQRAERARPVLRSFRPDAWGHARLAPAHPVTATFTTVDLTLAPVRFRNRTDVWAFEGTERV